MAAFVALVLATGFGWLQLLASPRGALHNPHRAERSPSHQWWFVVGAVAVIAGVAVQSWFVPGKGIGTGDVTPPIGTAWLGRLFDPWAWTGSNLGEPSQLSMNLPWAATAGAVHALGGDPYIAQRIWYTALFIGAGLSVVGLLGALRMSPAAALVGAMAYLFSANMISEVTSFQVYIAAAGLLAALPAVLIAAGTCRLSLKWGALLFCMSAPMVGYVFFNPPLVGMILAVVMVTPLLVAFVDGKEVALRTARALVVGVPLMVVVSAYWIVAAFPHLSLVASNFLGDISSWAWTEGRATIRNALWANTHWAWTYPEYFPYARFYDVPPLSVAKFIVPALAFGALAMGSGGDRGGNRAVDDNRMLRLSVFAATAALIVIFLSTGTNPPGNSVFGALYQLPFGWLLREPGRFLMVAALAYSVLIAAAVEILISNVSLRELLRHRRPTIAAFGPLYAVIAVGASVLMGFPLYTGAVVPDSRPPLPPAHVHVPSYWTEMASEVDRLPVQGAVLVMPPDDFYQMPYVWGYYGNDGFVVDLFKRRVVLPNPQGYVSTSPQLLAAVDATAQSILKGDWSQAEAMVSAMDTSLILVRRDIEVPFADRTIFPPGDLANSLAHSPIFRLLRQIGSLDLFELNAPLDETEVGSNFVTIDSQTPDLRLLSLLPPHTALVSGEARAGVPVVAQAPPLQLWQPQGDSFVWQTAAPPSARYRIANLSSNSVVTFDGGSTFPIDLAGAQVSYSAGSSTGLVKVSVSRRSIVANGDFASGLWSSKDDCNPTLPSQTGRNPSGTVIPNGAPGGLPALRLMASSNLACQSQTLDWHGGPIVVSLMIRRIEGAAPRVCVWEVGPSRCAQMPGLAATNGWFTYRASITPDAGTSALSLFLYADVDVTGAATTAEYADVTAVEVSALPDFVLFADASGQPTSRLQLIVVHDSFSGWWEGSSGSEHVLVDGMLNGWLVTGQPDNFLAYYKPATAVRAAQWTSLVTGVAVLLLCVAVQPGGRRRLKGWLPPWRR